MLLILALEQNPNKISVCLGVPWELTVMLVQTANCTGVTLLGLEQDIFSSNFETNNATQNTHTHTHTHNVPAERRICEGET